MTVISIHGCTVYNPKKEVGGLHKKWMDARLSQCLKRTYIRIISYKEVGVHRPPPSTPDYTSGDSWNLFFNQARRTLVVFSIDSSHDNSGYIPIIQFAVLYVTILPNA